MEKKYPNFTVQDFIVDESFIEWVNNPSPENVCFWEEFLVEHPHKRLQIEEAIDFIRLLKVKEVEVDEENLKKSLNKMLDSLKIDSRPRMITLFSNGFFQLAASLLIVGSIFLYLALAKTTVSTQRGEIRSVVLPDRSTVTLNEESTLSFYDFWYFRKKREVWLGGEAYFSIKNDSVLKRIFPRNFVAHTGAVDVRVLGTTFNIRNRNGKTDIFLNKGTIALSCNAQEEIMLTDNQAVSYQPSVSPIPQFQEVSKKEALAWRADLLTFDNTSVHQMAINIEKVTGYSVKIRGVDQKNIFISGALVLDSDASLVESLQFVLQLPVNLNDNTLYINY